MSIILDALVILVLLLTVYLSYRKGFIRTLLSIVSYIISFAISLFLGKILANWIFSNFLFQRVSDGISKKIMEAVTASGTNFASVNVENIVPDWITNLFLGGKTPQGVASSYLLQNNVEGASAAITQQIIEPLVVAILTVVLFAIVFVILRLIIRIIYKLTGIIDRVPVVGLLNGLLGGFLGIFKSLIYLVFIGIGAWIVIVFTGNSLGWLNKDIIDSTYLFYLFYNVNPFAW